MRTTSVVAMAIGTACLAFMTSCVTMETMVSPVAGTYKNNPEAAENAGRIITLNLFADKSCNLQTEKPGSGIKTETGSYTVVGRELTVTLTDPKGGTPKTLVFEKRMDQLVNKLWSKDIYGNAGIGTLKKK